MIGNISKSKGFKGDRGDALTFGDLTPEQKQELSAKIISVNASVDNTTGTPSVEVTMDGTEHERSVSLAFSGLKGEDGKKGDTGKQGNDGLSAYEVAVKNGFEGSEKEWLESLGDSEALNTHLQNDDNPHKVTAEQVGAYSKPEVDTVLDEKANKYELCVERNYIDIKINGDANFNGEVCGTYNPETDELIYGVGDAWREGDINSDGIDYWNYIEWESENDYLELPIEPITIKKGLYYITMFRFYGSIYDDIFAGDALYGYNEDGEINTSLYDCIVEIGGYNLERTNDLRFHLCDITEDITVSSIKIKAKTLGMRMTEHTFKNVTNGWYGSSGRLVSTSKILEYIDWADQDILNYTVREAKRLLEEKADKSDIENFEAQMGYVETTLKSKANKSDIVSAYKFRGSVPTFNDLSDIYREEGYVYNVRDTGMNYAWNGTEWDALGGEHRDIEAHHRLDILGEQKADKENVNTELGKKADKTYVDENLGLLAAENDRKADKDAVYTKAELYTQGQIDDALNNKANKSDVYTTTQIENKLSQKADKSEIIKNVVSNGSNITFNADKNTVGIIKELGSFTCTAIDESTNKYTFDVADMSVFEPSAEYKVTVGDADYLIRTSKINENNVIFVAVDAENKPTFDVGTAYSIRFETKNATSFGVNNTVYANEGFATGMANFIDETADQGVANGYKNKLSGKAHFVTGSLNNVSEGDRDTVFGAANVVKGNNKFVTGIGLLAEKTLDGSIVLGKYNEDVQDAIFILGAGTDVNRKNALVIDKSGNIIAYGTLTIDKNTTVNGKLNINDVTVINGTLDVNDATVINGTLDVKDNVTIKGVMKLNDSEVVTEATLLDKHNLFPKDINFVINGDITNQNGTLVAKHNGTNVNFSLNPTEYPYDGRRIRDSRTLIIPIEPVTLLGVYKKPGIYNSSDSELNNRFVNNEYYLKLFTDEANGVTETDDTYIVSKPTTINEVYLQTDKFWAPDDKYFTWDFIGSGYLDLSTVQLTDITAGFIGAATKEEIGNINAALEAIIEMDNKLIGGDIV